MKWKRKRKWTNHKIQSIFSDLTHIKHDWWNWNWMWCFIWIIFGINFSIREFDFKGYCVHKAAVAGVISCSIYRNKSNHLDVFICLCISSPIYVDNKYTYIQHVWECTTITNHDDWVDEWVKADETHYSFNLELCPAWKAYIMHMPIVYTENVIHKFHMRCDQWLSYIHLRGFPL